MATNINYFQRTPLKKDFIFWVLFSAVILLYAWMFSAARSPAYSDCRSGGEFLGWPTTITLTLFLMYLTFRLFFFLSVKASPDRVKAAITYGLIGSLSGLIAGIIGGGFIVFAVYFCF